MAGSLHAGLGAGELHPGPQCGREVMVADEVRAQIEGGQSTVRRRSKLLIVLLLLGDRGAGAIAPRWGWDMDYVAM